MGSSSLMCKCTTLSTCNGSPLPHAGQQCYRLWAQAHTYTTRVPPHLKAQRPALPPSLSASGWGKEWEDPSTRRCGSRPRENRVPFPSPQWRSARGWEGLGEGEGGAYHLVLYYCFVCPSWFPLPCYYPLLQDTVFVVETLFFPPITLEKGI